MRKYQHLLIILLAALLPLVSRAQTNPTPFDLSTGSWTLMGWANNVPSGSYPIDGATGTNNTTGVVAGAANANMVFWRYSSNDPQLLTSTPLNDYAGIYGATSGTRINGNDGNGFSFINTSSSGNLGAACLAINTTGRTNLAVVWTGRTISNPNARPYVIRLQYRIGTTGSFTDAGGSFLYTPGAAGSSQSITSTLPAAAENQPVVQVLWRYYQNGTGSNGRPELGVDDITVSSNPSGAPAAPPAPTVTQSCGSTTLNAYSGGQSSTYYWQGTNVGGTSTADPATSPFTATASGTYYVRAFSGGQWSSATSVSVTVINNPVITTPPANASVSQGSNTSFSVTATEAGSYQWEVSTNSGNTWTALTNTAPYSGATSATLTITGATLAMSGNQYRVVVGATSPCTVSGTSGAALLTVTPLSNATDYFRSRANGAYGAAGTWASSADSITWINATSAPTNAAHSVTIRAGDSVTVLNSGKSAAHLYLFGKLTLSGQDLAIADGSDYDAVIFNGGQFDCGTNNNGNKLDLSTAATVLVKTGGRIIARINKSLEGPGRSGADYFYEDAAVLEYRGSGAITTGSNAIYSLPTLTTGAVPVLLFSNTVGLSGANTPTTFNCFVEIGAGCTLPWSGTGQKIFNGGLLNNGTIALNNNTPLVLSGANTPLAGAGVITIGTGTGTNTGGMSIASGASVRLLSDVTINGVSTLPLTVNGTLQTNGHILSGTADFATAAGSTLIITDAAGISATGGNSGNIQLAGTRTFSTGGNYVYRSTAAQITGDGLPTASATLEIDNPMGITLSGAHTTTNALNLISGNLTTSTTALLSLGDAATFTSGSATSYINGPLRRYTAAATDFVFPIGNGSDYAPVTITPQAATASNYTAAYFSGNQTTPNRADKAAPLKYVAANEHFEISRGAGGADVRLTLSYTSAAQVTDPTTLVVAHYNGAQWVSEGQSARSGNNNAGTVTSANIVSSFSPFALGSTSASQPLPVQLLSFNLHKKESAALLEWELATTDGDEQVVVERSANGMDFVTVSSHKVSKAERLHQTFTDVMPMAGPNFYRLRIVSANGAVQFSKVLSVRFDGSVNGWSLYPNPTKDVLHLEWPDKSAPVSIRIYNAAGQLVHSEDISGQGSADVSVNGLAEGFYWVVMEQAGRVERQQVRVKR